MFNIADYFKKFSQIEEGSILQSDSIKSALKEICNIEGVGFELKKGILYIKGSPMAKSLIFTRKAALIEAIKKKHPQSKIYDVR